MKDKILTYLNSLNYPDLDNLPNRYTIINTIYKDLDKICGINTQPIINTKEPSSGSILHLIAENLLIHDVNILSINRMYPNIVKYLMENGVEKDSYYYLIDNYDYLKENIKDVKLFKTLVNYKFASLSRTNTVLLTRIIDISRSIMTSLLKGDMCQDIIYIDTDTIFYKTRDFEQTILSVLKEYNLTCEIKRNKSIYFIGKKRYMILNDSYTKGIEEYRIYTNKEIKNIAFKLSGQQDYTFFARKCKSEFSIFMEKAKIIYKRKNKLDRII